MISWKFKIPEYLPIGLDIGHNSIKMIQLSVNGECMSVCSAAKVNIAPEMNGDAHARRDFIVSSIQQMLAEGNFHGSDVVTALPSDKLKITSLRLAETDSEKIEQALRKEAGRRFGLDPEKDAVDYIVAGTVQLGDEVKNELILFAADNKTIKEHLEMLEEAQLRPAAIDIIPCALFRSFDRQLRRQEDRDQTVVFVDLGSQYTTVVFARGGQISFVKQIPIGGSRFNQQVASKLGIGISEAQRLREACKAEDGYSRSSSRDGRDGVSLDASTRQAISDAVGSVAQELTREISLCLRYYTVTFRGRRVERAILSGGQAYENILLSVLSRQLSVEIEIAQPLKGFDLSDFGASMGFISDRRGLLCRMLEQAWALSVTGAVCFVNGRWR